MEYLKPGFMKSNFVRVIFLLLYISFAVFPFTWESAYGAEWTIENAEEAFSNGIIVPENAVRYRKELTAKLTERQAEEFQEGIAVIYVPNVSVGDEDAIQGICYLPVELTDDHQLKANFSGLYVSTSDTVSENLCAQLITTRPILMSRQKSVDDMNIEFSLKGVFYGELDVMYNPFIFNIDYASNTARIESIALEETTIDPLHGYYSAYRYTYVIDGNKELPHFLDMKSTSWTLWYEKKIEKPQTLRLHPVSGAGCKVLFSIKNKDGTQYSLSPVDYD